MKPGEWAAAIFIILAIILGSISMGDEHPQKSQISEDDPGWDCHTMGNRICGN